jgi:hypothetical protein
MPKNTTKQLSTQTVGAKLPKNTTKQQKTMAVAVQNSENDGCSSLIH